MKKKLLRKIILVVLAIALSMAFFLWVQRGRQGELDGPYKVAYVIDGDTIAVDAGEEYALHVRLIGIDAPESASHDESQNTSEGAIASDYMKALLLDKQVYIEFDRERKDQYGRTLAYVYLEDRSTMVEKLLLSEGYVTVMTISPNTRYADEFEKLRKEAKKAGKGFWGTGYFK